MSSIMEKLQTVIVFSLLSQVIANNAINDVIVDVKSGQAVHIGWKPNLNESSVLGYIVRLIRLSSLDDSNNNQNNQSIDRQHTETYFNKTDPVEWELTGLLPGARYEVHIDSELTNNTTVTIIKTNFTTKPNRPSKELFCHYSVQNINVMWEPPLEPCFFDRYLVTISPPDDPKSVVYTEKGTQTTVFVDLIPGKAYNVSVQTISGSQISDPLTGKCRTQPSVPSRLELDTQTLTSFSFEIRWGVPRYQSEFDSYLVIKDDNLYRKVSNKENRTVKISEDIKPGKTYKIEIITRSDQISSKPLHLFVTTRPLPVVDLKAIPGKESDIYVEWKAGIGSTQDSYLVTYREVKSNTSGTQVVNKTIVHLSQLLSGHNYSIGVAALSNNVSSNVTTIFQPTRPAQPIFQGSEMNFRNHLTLSWKSSPHSDQKLYKISWTRVDNGQMKEEIEPHKQVNNFDFNYLYSGAKYMMNVSAVKYGLVSEPFTYFHTVAPKMPETLQITNTTNSSLIVQWSAPKDSLVDHYIVRMKIENQTFWRQLSPTNKTLVEITNLIPNQKYQIKVTSVSYGVESQEAITEETLEAYTVQPCEFIISLALFFVMARLCNSERVSG